MIFNREVTPSVRAYTIRIVGSLFTVFWHFWDKKIPDVVQETYLTNFEKGGFRVTNKRNKPVFIIPVGNFVRVYTINYRRSVYLRVSRRMR